MFTRRINSALSLALIQPSFAKDYLKIVSKEHEELSQFLPWVKQAKNESFFLDYIKQQLHAYANGESLICAIIFENNVVGIIGLNKIDTNLEKANLGYWLSSDYRGQGIITQCTQIMVDIAFKEYDLSKVEIKAAVENKASRAVPERLGFIFEGVITQAERVNDRLMDHAVYGHHRDAP